MCEDCNFCGAARLGGFCLFRFIHARRLQLAERSFDSCMREDCNPEGSGVGGVSGVLIHACAKIATGASAGLWSSFLIHACAKIAT